MDKLAPSHDRKEAHRNAGASEVSSSKDGGSKKKRGTRESHRKPKAHPTRTEATSREPSYPHSATYPYTYLLPGYGVHSVEGEYCRDKILPCLVPALESLLTHTMQENKQRYYETYYASVTKPSPVASDTPAQVLEKELAYDLAARWNPVQLLPPAPLQAHATDPLKWLAVELKRLAEGVHEAKRFAAEQARKEEKELKRQRAEERKQAAAISTASTAGSSPAPSEVATTVATARTGAGLSRTASQRAPQGASAVTVPGGQSARQA